jgi:excisionase family DNA binding protein
MPHVAHPIQRWTTPEALAAWLGLTAYTVRRWLRAGELPGAHVGSRHYTDDRPRRSERRKWRIYESDVQAVVERWRSGARLPAALWRR